MFRGMFTGESLRRAWATRLDSHIKRFALLAPKGEKDCALAYSEWRRSEPPGTARARQKIGNNLAT